MLHFLFEKRKYKLEPAFHTYNPRRGDRVRVFKCPRSRKKTSATPKKLTELRHRVYYIAVIIIICDIIIFIYYYFSVVSRYILMAIIFRSRHKTNIRVPM